MINITIGLDFSNNLKYYLMSKVYTFSIELRRLFQLLRFHFKIFKNEIRKMINIYQLYQNLKYLSCFHQNIYCF